MEFKSLGSKINLATARAVTQYNVPQADFSALLGKRNQGASPDASTTVDPGSLFSQADVQVATYTSNQHANDQSEAETVLAALIGRSAPATRAAWIAAVTAINAVLATGKYVAMGDQGPEDDKISSDAVGQLIKSTFLARYPEPPPDKPAPAAPTASNLADFNAALAKASAAKAATAKAAATPAAPSFLSTTSGKAVTAGGVLATAAVVVTVLKAVLRA